MIRAVALSIVTLLGGCRTPPERPPSRDATPPRAAPRPSATKPVDPGLTALAAWDALPSLPAAPPRAARAASRDPERRLYFLVDPRNKDFNNPLAVCGSPPKKPLRYQELTGGGNLCPAGVEGYLIARATGPGYVSRIWLTATTPFGPDPGFGKGEEIRIYLDDPAKPAYRAPLRAWRKGTAEAGPFVAPLTYWSGSLTSYLPLSYKRGVWITLARLDPEKVYYHQIDTVGLPEGTAVAPTPLGQLARAAGRQIGRARAAARSDHGLTPTAVSLAPRPGKPAVLLDRAGPATLRRLRLSLPLEHAARLGRLALRVVWDRATTPAVDVPLAALFGIERSPSSDRFETLPMAVSVSKRDGKQRLVLESFLPAPFARHGRIELLDRGKQRAGGAPTLEGKVTVTAGVPAGSWGYLHARYSQHRVDRRGALTRHPVISVRGRGRYVGTALMMSGQRDPKHLLSLPLSFLEGDELIWIDGALALAGTGTEDYFNAGFYFEEGRFDHPFAALIHRSQQGDRGAASAVRWHVLTDAIFFARSLRLEVEYGAPHLPHVERYASVAYLYLDRP